MQLGIDSHIPDGLLAANALLAENSRQGFGAWSGTVHQGFGVVISHTLLGIKGSLYDGGVWSRCTGKERDSESGNDYFGARYFASSMGRWMSPDYDESGDDPEPVPYADLGNPQTLNLYAYGRNNPVSKVDANGHEILCGPDLWNPQTNTLTAGQCVNLPYPPTTRQVIRQWVYEHTTSAKPGQQIPSMPRNASKAFDILALGGVVIGPKVKDTLDRLRNGDPLPPGQKGGGNFANDGRNGGEVLPKTDANGNPITYQEYDVEPSQKGVNRGTERIVKGSDGSYYYTNDHYQTFYKAP